MAAFLLQVLKDHGIWCILFIGAIFKDEIRAKFGKSENECRDDNEGVHGPTGPPGPQGIKGEDNIMEIARLVAKVDHIKNNMDQHIDESIPRVVKIGILENNQTNMKESMVRIEKMIEESSKKMSELTSAFHIVSDTVIKLVVRFDDFEKHYSK